MSWTGGQHGLRGFKTLGRRGIYGYNPAPRGPAKSGRMGNETPGIVPRIHDDFDLSRPTDHHAQDDNILHHENLASRTVSSLEGRASGFARRLFSASSISENQNHPDDLLSEIPEHAQAVTDLNSNSPSRPPFRDLPSLLISILAVPTPGPHPAWATILARHLSSKTAIKPLSNLQDLYLWVVRVGIPNAIIDNRRFMLHFYLRNSNAFKECRLRYDHQPPRSYYIPLSHEMQSNPPYAVPRHSIFQTYETPVGERFAQWLATPIHVPETTEAPWQLEHEESMLDGFLVEKEDEVRQVEAEALPSRTEGVLKTLWWLWMKNRELMVRQDAGWKDMEDTTG